MRKFLYVFVLAVLVGTFAACRDHGVTGSVVTSSETEKEDMIEVRKSVSYWRDAARRFKNNTVSMVALLIFIIVVVVNEIIVRKKKK